MSGAGGGRGAAPRRLAAPAYRLLVLLALRHAGGPLSKGELAWQVRANHPTITRVLGALHGDGLVRVEGRGDGSYAIHATQRGLEFLARHQGALAGLFGAPVEAHFRYGRRPPWLPAPA